MNPEEKTKLKELYRVLVDENDPQKLPYLHVLGDLVGQNTDFIALKSLLAGDNWPRAVDPNLICDQESETDKISRAEGILELLVEKDLKDKKFLDFGCGEGHVPYKSLVQEPTVTVGYDIKTNDHWTEFGSNEKLVFTDKLEEAKEHAPYDVILVYDVIDHVTAEESVAILKQVHELLDENGTVYLRAHPFCSRHATHLYHNINKSFIHLVFSADELQQLGYEAPPNAKVVYPITQYGQMFEQAGFTVSHHNILREKVEPFFLKNPVVKERVRLNYANSPDKHIKKGGFPEFQLEQQFIDYVLKR